MTKKWTDMPELPIFFDRYITKVADLPLLVALQFHHPSVILADMEQLVRLGDRVYAPGKWTARDIIQHITDTERVLAYRALRFARNDKTPLPGFDEQLFAKNASATNRTLESLKREWELLRTCNIALFESFDDEMLTRTGTAFQSEISVLALGFVICGHAVHHAQVLKERYLPLIG
jgi:hypothetical protein